MTNAMTHQDRLQWLAEREVECPNLSFSSYNSKTGYIDCPVCKGTGKVARFPMLRRECPTFNYVSKYDECEKCQGRGWLPVDNLEAILEAMATVGLDGSWREPHGIVPYWYVELDKDHEFAGRGKGATFNEALVQAFCEAVKREGEA